jgi:hypothetical protein
MNLIEKIFPKTQHYLSEMALVVRMAKQEAEISVKL